VAETDAFMLVVKPLCYVFTAPVSTTVPTRSSGLYHLYENSSGFLASRKVD